MASSDNVVRAGFTPKFKDVPTLVDMLTYSSAPIDAQKMVPLPFTRGSNSRGGEGEGGKATSVVYDPPIEEFAVVKTELASGQSEVFEGVEGPSVLVCTGGRGSISVGPKKERVETGWVFFVGATAKVVLEAEGEEGFITFRAFTEVKE